MKKIAGIALVTLIGTGLIAAEKKECVCFELEGEFGKEIKAILQKYAKNLGDQNIKVYKESAYDVQIEDKGIQGTVLGIFQPEEDFVVKQTDTSYVQAEATYKRDCATCHGAKGEIEANGISRKISEIESGEILDALISYRDGTYQGIARFVKQSASETMSISNMRLLADYIVKLDE